MFAMKQPFYQVDDLDGSWTEAIQANAESVDDDQPEMESETKTEEEVEQVTEETAEVTEETATKEEEATEQSTLDDETEIDLGEGRQAVKLAELKSGYLRQSDYTKKTQELATQRKDFESELSEVEPLRGMKHFLDSNPWLQSQINTFIQEFSQTGSISLDEAIQDAQYGQYINSLMAHNNQLRQELDSISGKYGELEFGTSMDKVVSELKREYGDLLTEEYETSIRGRAKEQSLSSDVVKEIADGHLSKQKLLLNQNNTKKTKKDTEVKTIQSLQEQRSKLPTPRSTGQRPSAVTKPIEDMDWIEAIKAGVK